MKLFYIASGIIIVTFIASVTLFVWDKPPQSTPKLETKTVALSITPQTPSSSVTIEQVTLIEPGFVAIRSIEGDRLGQIIEISPYLLPGEHANLEIELGEFYDGNAELIAVVYKDEKSDMNFNDFDQPLRDAGGNVTARYVKTGEVVSSALFTNTGENQPHMMGGMKMETVRYTNDGYEPPLLSVPVGTMVQFVNESDVEMWVASNEHPAHTDLPTFDQFGFSELGEQYMYTFDAVGAWRYHDHLNPTAEGTIIVE
jgi:plastocyanin